MSVKAEAKQLSFKYFQNKDCEYYPCHDSERINCLFCFCPLYNMDCGGNFKIINGKDGEKIKDCTECLIPHSEGGYDYVIKRLKER